MEGRIWLESSEPGVGSTFCFTLPLGVSSKAERSHRRLIEELIPKLSGLRALIADDNEVAREVLRDILQEFRFEVRTVRSGEEAIAELQSPEGERGYDVVLMDWKMPGMHGDEATVRIHRDAAIQPKPKVIIVTSYGRDEVMRVAEQAGVDGFLIKPVTPSTLLDAIMAALGHDMAIFKREPQPQREAEAISFRGNRVLLVEDNEVNREFATELLASLDVEVDHAHNGKVALARVQQRTYDAVLMDIQMPLMDGYEATQRIRNLAQQPGGEHFATLPIIAMTAQAMAGDRERALEAGMSDYIAKPIDPPQLITLLREWLRGEAAAAGEAVVDACTLLSLPDDLKRLQSLDAEQGMRRMACNENAYRKMLLRFHERYADSASGLHKLIAEGHLVEAERLCHAFKGVVGNIGADALFETAASIDEELKEEQPPAEGQLQQFEALLATLLDEIATILPEAKEAAVEEEVVVDRVRLLALLAELKLAIDDDLVAAQTLIGEVEELVSGSEWAEAVRPITERVEEFDTDGAKQLITHLEERLV
jgi:CheY-like chemotaxis protein/HPt (histidine-containing phosphotransfer) domain-containing protein